MTGLYNNDASAAIHETMEALHEVGAIDKQTMRDFDAACIFRYHYGIHSVYSRLRMSDATLLIKRIPSELKQWLADEAARNARSMNKETIRLLEEARAQREAATRPARNTQAIARLLKDLQAMPVLDARTMDEALYDETGMPK